MTNAEIVAAVATLVPVLTPFLVALGKGLLDHLPAAQREVAISTIRSAVLAAEQVYARLPGSGQAKEEFVVRYVSAALAREKIAVDPTLLKVIMEEAVFVLNAQQGKSTQGVEEDEAASAGGMGFIPTEPVTVQLPAAPAAPNPTVPAL